MAVEKKTRNENGVVRYQGVIHKLTCTALVFFEHATRMWELLQTRMCLRYSEALLLHQPWKKKVGFCSLSIVDGRNCLLNLLEIEKVLTNIKVNDVKVIPIPKHCDWDDFMVLATGGSTWHVKNIAQALIYKAPHPPFFAPFIAIFSLSIFD
ncbi:Protein Iojap-related [Vigna angularis]|uniref:Protein Iojap-related n=2 Tax=Phaseolus angularis TaxID=3914 RepID=A0A8T0LHF1_PHAAN|nr:protein Iojap-related, mitochondrial-like [Vigna angularis]KAG2409585.1 Protein Iojap-related [Vigna angularis]BAT74433.1 hypothetical protein VIGAN_01210200 [Vigna angularis var. angularis]